MPQLTTTFRDFYDATALPWIRKVVKHEFKMQPVFYTKLFQVRGSDRGVEQASGLFGVGLLTKIGQRESVGAMQAQQAYNTTFAHERFGGSIETSIEAVEDDKWGVIAFSHQSLVRATQTTREYQHAQIFWRAFSGSFLGPDGVSLCSTAHPKVGFIQSNRASVSADLDYLPLSIGMTDFMGQRDGAGNFINSTPGHLVVAPRQNRIALEITAAGSRPDVANRAQNVLGSFPGGMPQVMAWPHLATAAGGSDWAWFLVGKQNGLVSYDRRAPYPKTWVDDPTEAGFYAIRYRLSRGWEMEDGVWGNPGVSV